LNILVRDNNSDLQPVQASFFMKCKLLILAVMGLGGVYILINEDESPGLEMWDVL